ncbi:hypothetical protein MAPG_03353 [Magnaporthiopsis poae ATCC 64411]|uniref:Uncharacterized protein n=1 Tax=Magnaporthiopsis poae (strain ATCC 64411 / 73-15) TaxID=644358 RepID=A0A0C4DTS9_MAGP6|nr:hypothetical protein MAPG_03353 [Magnaporthiopsis poae ATCC 64411]
MALKRLYGRHLQEPLIIAFEYSIFVSLDSFRRHHRAEDGVGADTCARLCRAVEKHANMYDVELGVVGAGPCMACPKDRRPTERHAGLPGCPPPLRETLPRGPEQKTWSSSSLMSVVKLMPPAPRVGSFLLHYSNCTCPPAPRRRRDGLHAPKRARCGFDRRRGYTMHKEGREAQRNSDDIGGMTCVGNICMDGVVRRARFLDKPRAGS